MLLLEEKIMIRRKEQKLQIMCREYGDNYVSLRSVLIQYEQLLSAVCVTEHSNSAVLPKASRRNIFYKAAFSDLKEYNIFSSFHTKERKEGQFCNFSSMNFVEV
jgi:hypothetical protein